MPKRHGLKWLLHEPSGTIYPTCQIGIQQVFEALGYCVFRRGFRSRVAVGNDPATTLKQHGHAVARRLLYSLDQLQTNLAGYAGYAGSDDGKSLRNSLNHGIAAEVAADSIAHYLSMFVDDVAKAIPFVFDETCDQLADGFSEVKAKVGKGEYHALEPLFDALSEPDSWWMLALQRGQGVRQRITHYPDLMSVQASRSEHDFAWSPGMYLFNHLDGNHVEYVGTLRRADLAPVNRHAASVPFEH